MNWKKSTRSHGNVTNCVEVAYVPDGTAIRDSKNQHGPTLGLPAQGSHGIAAFPAGAGLKPS